MTASNQHHTAESAEQGASSAESLVRKIDGTCRTIVDGRRAARALARWVRRFELSEPEFQLLWRLRLESNGRLDQTTLAHCLALSPAQVSATVERLHAAGWIDHSQATGDRRRNLWQLTSDGCSVLQKMLADTGCRMIEFGEAPPAAADASESRKEAA